MKRARGGKKKDDEEEKTKDDIIDDVLKELNDLSKRTGSLTGDSVLLKIGQIIVNIVTQASNDPRSAHTILQSMSRESLVQISGSLDASSTDLKLNTLKNILFKTDFEDMRNKEQSMSILKESMKAAVKLLFVKSFSNEFGLIQWNSVKTEVEEIKKQIDKAEGAREAMAAAAKQGVGTDVTM